MEYGKIIAVTGLSGLYELLSSKNDGAIVRSLEDKSTKFVSSRVHNFSHLESIEVFTVRDNVNLIEIFQAMESATDKAPDTKDAGKLKKYFETVFPDIDFERVYSSDLKKMVKWFSVLKDNGVEIKLSPRGVEEAEETIEETPAKESKKEEPAKPEEETEVAAKPKKAAAKKKPAAAKEEETDDENEAKKTVAKKPAKKAAAKKKTEE